MKRFWIAVSVCGLLLLVAPTTSSQEPGPSLLLGGVVSKPFTPADVDPAFPSGARRRAHPRPTSQGSVCSGHRPLCVHRTKDREHSTRREGEVLELLESAYDQVVLALGLPAPLPDQLGPSPALDLYLLDRTPTLQVWSDPPLRKEDSTSAHCTAASSLFDEAAAVRCVAEASLFGLDAGETPSARRALSTYIGWLVHGVGRTARQALDDAQANPQIGLMNREIDTLTEAGALWWAFLDGQYGEGPVGWLPVAIFQLSQQSRSLGKLEWQNEPDSFDVVRRAFDDEEIRFADVAIQFAIARMFLGDRADGAHPPNLRELGPLGRVRFDWTVPYSSLPRHLATPRAIEPMGSTYVWLDLDEVPLGARLGARFEWEAPVRFKWNVVAVDSQGREMQRWDVPYLPAGEQVEKTLMNFEGAKGLAFVGINLGGVDPKHPFDPDHEPWEPHAAQIYLAPL